MAEFGSFFSANNDDSLKDLNGFDGGSWVLLCESRIVEQ